MPYHLVNFNQSRQERQAKYLAARLFGCSNQQARKYRDFRWSNIARYIGAQKPELKETLQFFCLNEKEYWSQFRQKEEEPTAAEQLPLPSLGGLAN